MTGIRVAVLAEQMLAPVPGGTGRYSAELASALARTAADGDTVTGWTAWHRDVAAARLTGVAGPRRLPLPRRPLAAAWEYGIGPAPRRTDLVHAPTPLLPPPSGRPLVVTVHDTIPWTHPATLTARGARWHRRMVHRAAAAGAVLTTPSRAVALDLAALVPGSAASRITVLGAGVAAVLWVEPTPDSVAEVTRRLALPDRFVVTLATLEPRKGLDVLVEALGALGAKAPPALVVGQPGWGGVDLGAAARRAGLAADRVRVLGRIDDSDLGVVLRRASLLVAPSRAEGFDLPVAEAMAVGTPVVCSDIPVHREVAGDAARFVAVGDPLALAAAVSELSADPHQCAELARRGRLGSARFDWDQVARRAWTLYRTLA